MGLWRGLLRFLGLSGEALVRVRAPKIEVVIRGEPARVRLMLDVVKRELERNPRFRAPRVSTGRLSARGSHEVVSPSELDEKDSPYILPEALVLPIHKPSTNDKVPLQTEPDRAQTARTQPLDGLSLGPTSAAAGFAPEGSADSTGPAPRASEWTPNDEWSEQSFRASEEETPADFEMPFGSEETVHASAPEQPMSPLVSDPPASGVNVSARPEPNPQDSLRRRPPSGLLGRQDS